MPPERTETLQQSSSDKAKIEIGIQTDQDSEEAAYLLRRPREKRKRQFGSAKGLITMDPDFDAPLDDFKEYMK